MKIYIPVIVILRILHVDYIIINIYISAFTNLDDTCFRLRDDIFPTGSGMFVVILFDYLFDIHVNMYTLPSMGLNVF